ncbi:MAG: mechanosensitive ion channel family protein [Bacteroidota bacterium]
MELLQAFYSSIQQFWFYFREQIPRFVAAVLLLLLGWIIARLIEKSFVKFFRLIRLEEIAEKAGIENFLYRGGVKFTTSTLLAKLVYWFIMFTFTLAVLNSLGLQSAADLFNKMVLYIPNLIVAFIVLLFGTLFAKFAHTASNAYLNNIGMTGAEGMSLVIKYAILIFVASMVLEQLNIGGQILVSGFQIAFGALCFALALAFGLGGKDWASKIIERLWKSK